MQKYAFFDVDNTIYDGYSTSDFYLFLAEKGIGPDDVKARDKKIGEQYHSGEIDYTEASIQVVQRVCQ